MLSEGEEEYNVEKEVISYSNVLAKIHIHNNFIAVKIHNS